MRFTDFLRTAVLRAMQFLTSAMRSQNGGGMHRLAQLWFHAMRSVHKHFLRYLQAPQTLPAWEKPNMLAKYHVTTSGVQLARSR